MAGTACLIDNDPQFDRTTYGIGTVWRHAATGIEVGKFPDEPFYVVSVPVAKQHVEVFTTVLETLDPDEAYAAACDQVAIMRAAIEKAEAQALVEHFERFPLVANESSVMFKGNVHKVWRTGHVLWLQADPADDDTMIQIGDGGAWPISRTGA
jgi:hypothetical protein